MLSNFLQHHFHFLVQTIQAQIQVIQQNLLQLRIRGFQLLNGSVQRTRFWFHGWRLDRKE